MPKKRITESFDEMCRFDVRFDGVIGSEAHRAHHETLMAKLAARAFVIEEKAKREAASKPANRRALAR